MVSPDGSCYVNKKSSNYSQNCVSFGDLIRWQALKQDFINLIFITFIYWMRLFVILWDEEKCHSDIICGDERIIHLGYSLLRKQRILCVQWDGPVVNSKIIYGSFWPKKHMKWDLCFLWSTSQNPEEQRLVSSKGNKHFFLRGSRKALESGDTTGYPKYWLYFVCLLISAHSVTWLDWNVAVNSLRPVWDLETKLGKMGRKHQFLMLGIWKQNRQ